MELIILLVIVGIAFFSWVSYGSKRLDAKEKLNALKDSTPVRQLTQEEIELLRQGFSPPVDPQERNAAIVARVRQMHGNGGMPALIGTGVHALRGDYHEYIVQNEGVITEQRQLLGGVEVLFPYDGWGYVRRTGNEAEVVLTEDHALVIRLNNGFDLESAWARHQRLLEPLQQWQAGTLGSAPAPEVGAGNADDPGREVFRADRVVREPLPDSDVLPRRQQRRQGVSSRRPAPSAAPIVPDPPQGEEQGVLLQRQESSQEVIARAGGGTAFLGATAIAFALLFLWVAADADSSRVVWMWASTLLAGLGIWLSLRKPGLPEPGLVNRVRGELFRWGDEPQHRLRIAGVDEPIPVTIPGYWNTLLVDDVGSVIDVDMRVSDYTAVRLNDVLSIDREIDGSMPVYWGRWLYLSMASLVMFLLFALTNEGVVQAFQRARMAVLGTPVQVFETPEQLRQALPNLSGSAVHLRGAARCTLRRLNEPLNNDLDVDCSALRWGGDVPSRAISDEQRMLLPYHDGSFVSVQRDEVREKRLERNIPLAQVLTGRYGIIPQYDIDDPEGVVSGMNALCSRQAQLGIDCTPLQDALVSMVFGDDEGGSWQDLEHRFVGDHASRHLETDEERLATLRDTARSVVQPAVERMIETMKRTALSGQESGIGIFSNVPVIADMSHPWDGSRWNALQTYLLRVAEQGEMPFEMSGHVREVNPYKGMGEIYIQDESTFKRDSMGALLHSTGWFVAGVLMLASGGLCLLKRNQQRTREEAIVQTYAERLGISGFA